MGLWPKGNPAVSNNVTDYCNVVTKLRFTFSYGARIPHSICHIGLLSFLSSVPSIMSFQCADAAAACFSALRFHDFFMLASCLFQGDIQQLLIMDDAEAAANYCVNYIPDCDSALPYNSQALALQEVSTATVRRWCLLEKNLCIFVVHFFNSYNVQWIQALGLPDCRDPASVFVWTWRQCAFNLPHSSTTVHFSMFKQYDELWLHALVRLLWLPKPRLESLRQNRPSRSAVF